MEKEITIKNGSSSAQIENSTKLLPAFVPIQRLPTPDIPSSPPANYFDRGNGAGVPGPPVGTFYPSPVPTSSTGLATSSPSKHKLLQQQQQQQAVAVNDTDSDKALHLPCDGSKVTLGRSSKSSTVAFTRRSNRQVSRVHVECSYLAHNDTISITCIGWNGVKILSEADTTSSIFLHKGSSTVVPGNQRVIIDVCGERAVILPQSMDEDETEDEDMESKTSSFKIWSENQQESQNDNNIVDDVRPPLTDLDQGPSAESPTEEKALRVIENGQKRPTQALSPKEREDEPKGKARRVEQEQEPQQENNPPPMQEHDELEIKNFLANHLAFSRLTSTPLSTIIKNFPTTTTNIDDDDDDDENHNNTHMIAKALEGISCVGVIQRQGKDAAGKPLEAEYYYIPEQDDDLVRRRAIEDMRGRRGLRACRKTHKQYYWKKPPPPR